MNEQTNMKVSSASNELEELREKVASLTDELGRVREMYVEEDKRSTRYYRMSEELRERIKLIAALAGVIKPDEFIKGSEVFERIAAL